VKAVLNISSEKNGRKREFAVNVKKKAGLDIKLPVCQNPIKPIVR